MIDALLYAVRDGIRAAGLGYDQASCQIMDDGKPPPRTGNYFVAIHGGNTRAGPANDNNLFELYEFSITLTMRVTIPLDRVGDQLMSRNLERIPLGERQGFYARAERLRALLHMNWGMVVLQGQTPSSANDNLKAWGYGATTYGFCEPARYQGPGAPPKLVGGEWFGAEPDNEDVGMTSELRFTGAKRFQPITTSVGPFV